MRAAAGAAQGRGHKDRRRELTFMKLDYDERSIELGGADGARYFDRAAGLWREACIHFNLSVERTIFGITIPVMPLDQLVEYRQRLDREVDRQDVAALIAEYERDPADTIS